MLINRIVHELNEKLKGTGLFTKVNPIERQFYIEDCCFDRVTVEVPLSARYVTQCRIDTLHTGLEISSGVYELIDGAIRKVLATPSSKLLAEEKYTVSPDGLDSSRGKQYLSTDGADRIFFAAKNNSLKQSFTNDELQSIVNFTADELGISWLTSVINQYKKPVE